MIRLASVSGVVRARKATSILLDQIDHLVGGENLQPHLGVVLEVGGDQRLDRLDQADGATETDQPLGLAARLGHHRLGALGVDEHGAASLIEGLAHFGDAETPVRALDQASVEPLLQLGDASAEFGLRYAQGAAGGGESAMGHNLGEIVEVVQILHDAPIVPWTPWGVAIAPLRRRNHSLDKPFSRPIVV